MLLWWVAQVQLSSSRFDACPIGTGCLRDGLACGVHGPKGHVQSWSRGRRFHLPPGRAIQKKGLLVRLGEHGGGDKGGEKGCDDYTHKLDAREHYGSPMLSPVDGCRRDNLMAAAATVLWDLVAVRFSFSGFSTALRTISTVF